MDLAHLRYVHYYHEMRETGELEVDGPILVSHNDFERRRRFGPVRQATITIDVLGLGYSFVDMHEHTIDMHSRLCALATPSRSPRASA